jgi:hypothetical protein
MNKYQKEFDDCTSIKHENVCERQMQCEWRKECKVPVYLGEGHETIIGWVQCPEKKMV